MDQRKIPVTLPNGMACQLIYHKTELGDWVSVLPHQTMLDLIALLNGEEPKQEYVKPNTGDIPSWVTL